MPTEILLPDIQGIRIVRPLGRGGMGAVYLAGDEWLHCTVALKVIAFEGGPDPSARARFDREIEAVSSIHHANVVRVLRSGVANGVPYAEFERIRGRSLARIGVLPWPFVVDIGRQLASAVAAVHAAGWVHRDIKPSNVMVCAHGLVTLIDFGVAKRPRTPRLAIGSATDVSRSLTLRGKVVGTRRFLAPELLQGRSATAASDVYALGLTLRDQLDHATPPPLTLTALVERSLATDPGRRPTAAAIAAALATLPGRPGRFTHAAVGAPPAWPTDADQRATRDDRASCRAQRLH